jgi:hypothetical protein
MLEARYLLFNELCQHAVGRVGAQSLHGLHQLMKVSPLALVLCGITGDFIEGHGSSLCKSKGSD